MTTAGIIEELYLSPEVDRCIAKMVTKDLQGDFKQELFIIIGTMKADVLHTLYNTNRIKFYVTRIIINLAHQSRNTFLSTYKNNRVTYDTDAINRANPPSDYDQMEERIAAEDKELRQVAAVENMDEQFNTPYFRLLSHAVCDMGSMRKVSRETGVSVSAISRGIDKVRKHIADV